MHWMKGICMVLVCTLAGWGFGDLFMRLFRFLRTKAGERKEWRIRRTSPCCASCPYQELYAKAARERDMLRKENEDLRQRVTGLMAEREMEKTDLPKNSYEALERAWNVTTPQACCASSPDKGSQGTE